MCAWLAEGKYCACVSGCRETYTKLSTLTLPLHLEANTAVFYTIAKIPETSGQP